jgi:hypothetical protein
MFDEKRLKTMLSKKRQEANEAARRAHETQADLAAIERVMELFAGDEAKEEEAPTISPNAAAAAQQESRGNGQAAATAVRPIERQTLYRRGLRAKREGPPREGSIAAQSIQIVQKAGKPLPLDSICSSLREIRNDEVNRLSVDRILRREIVQGTLKAFGESVFGLPDWHGGQNGAQPEEIRLS